MINWIQKNFISITVFIVLLINFLAYYFLGDLFIKYDYLWLVIITLEITGFYFFVISYFLFPLGELRKQIAAFLTGGDISRKLELESAHPRMKYVINFFNKSLEILKNFKDELRSGKELKSEVQLASEIQKNTLTKNFPVIQSIDIVANTKSATEVGGDSYDVINHNDNYYIYLGDVTGHGVASGFVMMMVNALISGFSKMTVSSAEIIANTNEILKPRVPSNMLMTLLMVRWNEAEKKMYMTGAGHEYLLVYKKEQQKAFKIKSGGVALGMTKNISKIVKESQLAIEEGDIIVLYTDGITEARNTNTEDGMMMGIDRLVEIIEKSSVKTAQGVFNNITIELSRWMGYNHKQFDDITLVVLHYKGNKPVENDVSPVIANENITEWYWNNK